MDDGLVTEESVDKSEVAKTGKLIASYQKKKNAKCMAKCSSL